MGDLTPLFNPQSIAFIGASENSGYFRNLYDNLQDLDESIRTFYVNPNHDSIFNSVCYDSVSDISEHIDLAYLLIPAQIVPTVFQECCDTGVGACVIASAGYAETSDTGRELQETIVEMGASCGISFVGPNTFGLISIPEKFPGLVIPLPALPEGKIGCVTQSGGLLMELLYSGIARDFGFTKVVDSGNQASLSEASYVEHFINDDMTEVIVGIIESFSEPTRFYELCEKAEKQDIPVIIHKIARSEEAKPISRSHTGSEPTPFDEISTQFDQHGVVQTETLDELVETMEIYSSATTNLQNNEIAIIEISGGGCSSYVDAIADSGLELAEFSADLKEELRSYIPDHIGRVGNPIDLGGIGGWSSDTMASIYPDLLELLDDMSESGTVILRINPPESVESKAKIQRLRETSTRNDISDKQFVIGSRTSRCASREWIEHVHNQNLPFLQGYNKTIRAIDNYSTFYLTDEGTE